MRKIIAWEGDEMVPGQILEINSLKWSNEPIPVTRHADDWAQPPIGNAGDLRREDNGSITAEIELIEELDVILNDMSFTVYCNEVKALGPRDVRPLRVTTARIRAIFSDTTVPW